MSQLFYVKYSVTKAVNEITEGKHELAYVNMTS